MKDTLILAIETSCDETSMAIVKNGNEVLAMTVLTQMDKHAEYGGVVPEIASRMHVENITIVIEDLMKQTNLKIADMDAIAVANQPGLLGSLLVGLECAKTLSFVYNKPLIAVNHIAGHIYANCLNSPLQFPLLALVVSGGHTDLVIMEADYKFKVIGSTLDDAIGESFDKVSRVLGLGYPGGPKIEEKASLGVSSYDLGKPMSDNGYNFSYSGLKSNVINLVHNEAQRGNSIRVNDLARSFQETAIEQLVRKSEKALVDFKINNMIIAGGVSANKFLRAEIKNICDKHNVKLSIPDFKYCTDNAAMVGCAAYPLFKEKKFAALDLNASPRDELF